MQGRLHEDSISAQGQIEGVQETRSNAGSIAIALTTDLASVRRLSGLKNARCECRP
jgi:hypothetical protein